MTKIIGELIPVVLLLFLATKQDLSTGRISNRLILTGYGWGAARLIITNGISGIGILLIKAAWPIVILYGLFLIGAMGAGDIKLFSAISTLVSNETLLSVILISFFIGAGIACVRILKYFVRTKILGISTDRFEETIRFGICISMGYFLTLLGDILL